MSNEVSFLIAFATVFGASEAIKHIQSQARKKEHRSRKNNLVVHCLKSCQYSSMLEGRRVVLSGDKLYIDTGTRHDEVFGHPFAGYYLPYSNPNPSPDSDSTHTNTNTNSNASGLVSTICDEPPVMNWIYVDRWSHELKFGNRAWADDNWPVPWDCTRQDRRLTFGGWEGFCAVKEEGRFWALYFDVDGDGLRTKVPEGTPVLEVVLLRVEMRTPKPVPLPEKKEEEKEKKVPDGGSDKGNGYGGKSTGEGIQTSAAGGGGDDDDGHGNGGVQGAGNDEDSGLAPMTPPPEEPLESPPVD
ncbi:hypothetical protein F5Y17DRAFT_244502 [Xylariaceae sp. FL0594]|nr:hypothetical protein F5Y17DRAFT_244502 [Xylariaceae sp. FL0594]